MIKKLNKISDEDYVIMKVRRRTRDYVHSLKRGKESVDDVIERGKWDN